MNRLFALLRRIRVAAVRFYIRQPRNRRPAVIVAGITAIPLCICCIAVVHGVLDIRFTSQNPSLFLLDNSYRFIAAVENDQGDFGYWDMPDTLPRRLVTAAMAAEDRRFLSHEGVDIRAVIRAAVNNCTRQGPFSGASTIAMQVARLQRRGGAGIYGKIHDAVAAMGLTMVFGRNRVMRRYLTIAPYGNRIAGAACAARRYFHKPAQDLSFAEAALLSGIPKAPSRMNLFSPRGFSLAKRRARLIINRMGDYGWMDEQSRAEALTELSTFSMPPKELREEACFHFIRACGRRLHGAPHGRGEIRTTLDLDIQDTALAALRRAYHRLAEYDANNAAAMVVDVRTGGILAYIGSIDYFDSSGGAIDCAALPRSTGSLLKPFIYAAGMEWQGFTAATVLTDLGFDFGSGPRSFIPENCDRAYLGPVLYKCALANSRNIPAVQVLRDVGVAKFYQTCAALGLSSDDGRADFYGLGLSIGGLYCTLQQLCAAYLTLANAGEKQELTWVAPAASDTVTLRHRQVISPDIALQIRTFLSDPVARLPTFPRGGNLEYPFAVAVKTGTSEGFRDSWCMAWSDRYLVGVWAGNTDFSSTKNMSGYLGAAGIAKSILLSLHSDRADGLSDRDFPVARGYIPVKICRLSGKRADRFTPYITTEYFKPGTEPMEYSTIQRLLPIDPANGLLAIPGGCIRPTYRRFLVLPPEFSDWAASQGLEVAPDRISPRCGAAPLIDNYDIAITSPRNGSRIIIDPEMPAGQSVVSITCRVFPPPKEVVWFVDNAEYRVVGHPFTLKWPLTPGTHLFQVGVAGTPFKSAITMVEVF